MTMDISYDPHEFLSAGQVPPGVHRDLYTLWLEKVAEGRLPGRDNFRPEEMPRLLPYITLFKVERDPLRYFVRLVGTAVVDATGFDNTGRYLDELNCIEHTLERCGRLVETRAPYFHADLPMPWSPNDFRTYSVLGLPLASDGATVDMILGALIFD